MCRKQERLLWLNSWLSNLPLSENFCTPNFLCTIFFYTRLFGYGLDARALAKVLKHTATRKCLSVGILSPETDFQTRRGVYPLLYHLMWSLLLIKKSRERWAKRRLKYGRSVESTTRKFSSVASFLRKNSEHTLDIFRGRWPTIVPFFCTATAYLSWALVDSLLQASTSPTTGFHLSLYTW